MNWVNPVALIILSTGYIAGGSLCGVAPCGAGSSDCLHGALWHRTSMTKREKNALEGRDNDVGVCHY